MIYKQDIIADSILVGNNNPWKILFVGQNNRLCQQLKKYCQNIVFLHRNCSLLETNYSIDTENFFLEYGKVTLVFLLVKNLKNFEFSLPKEFINIKNYLPPKVILFCSEKQYLWKEKIIDNKEGICIFSEKGDICFVNQSVINLLGCQEEELMGKSWLKFLKTIARSC